MKRATALARKNKFEKKLIGQPWLEKYKSALIRKKSLDSYSSNFHPALRSSKTFGAKMLNSSFFKQSRFKITEKTISTVPRYGTVLFHLSFLALLAPAEERFLILS